MTPKHKAAIKIFERDDWTCSYCDRQFSPDYAPLHRHRRVFGSQGGTYDTDNVATACNDCHAQPNHANLKNKKLNHEDDMSVMNELNKKYNKPKCITQASS